MTKAAVLLLGLGLLAAGCSDHQGDYGPSSQYALAAPSNAVGPGGHYKVGDPYEVAGVWYHPKAEPSYDEVGVASWYGPKFHGRRTANGETYDQYAMTAAHPTLPMPSLVEVTNLANGRKVILRINDRGPFAKGRIIDVSKAAAKRLGFKKKGTTRVRVRVVEEEQLRLAGQQGKGQIAGGPQPDAAPVEAVAETTLPAPEAAVPQTALPQTAASDSRQSDRSATQVAGLPSSDGGGTGQVFLQAGAFRDYGNALRQAESLSGVGEPLIEAVPTGQDVIYRVRIGPVADRALAEKLRAALRGQGIVDSHIVVK